MAKQISVCTGLEEYEICNEKHEKMGSFWFNPADTGIVNRHSVVEKKIPEIFEALKMHDIDSKGEPIDESFEAVKKLEEAVIEQIDYLLNSDTKSSFFATVSPFASVGGKFYVEQVLDVIRMIIEGYYAEEMKKQKKRSEAYMKGLR